MNETKAARYQRLRRRAHVAATLAGGATLAAIALTPLARWLAGWSLGLGEGLSPLAREAVAVAGLVVVLLGVWEIAALPALISLARRDRRFLAQADLPEQVVLAQAQAACIALPIGLIAAWIWRASTAIAGPWWWLLAGPGLAGLSAIAMRGAPLLLSRLARTVPLGDRALAARLDALARRAGVTLGSIEEWRVDEGSGRSALVVGTGRGRRVLVASDLARHWSHDEIAVVVAHELAHHRHRDLSRALALDAALLIGATLIAQLAVSRLGPALGLAGPWDLAALPLLAVAGGAAWLAATPLRHAQSRRHERRADAMALALTGEADAFSAALRRLGGARLAEERPSTMTRWFFHRHPPLAERLASAEAWRRAQSRAS